MVSGGGHYGATDAISVARELRKKGFTVTYGSCSSAAHDFVEATCHELRYAYLHAPCCGDGYHSEYDWFRRLVDGSISQAPDTFLSYQLMEAALAFIMPVIKQFADYQLPPPPVYESTNVSSRNVGNYPINQPCP